MEPADIAAFDQFLAGANAKLDGMAKSMREGIAEEGEPTAMTSVYTILSGVDHDALASMLTVALRRLAVTREEP